jgi:hypothetical protein
MFILKDPKIRWPSLFCEAVFGKKKDAHVISGLTRYAEAIPVTGREGP